MAISRDLKALQYRIEGLRELEIELAAYDRKVQDYRGMFESDLHNYSGFRGRLNAALFWLGMIVHEEQKREQDMLAPKDASKD